MTDPFDVRAFVLKTYPHLRNNPIWRQEELEPIAKLAYEQGQDDERAEGRAMIAHCAQGIELLEEIKRAAICAWPDVAVLSEIMDPHKQKLAEALDAYTRFLNQEKAGGHSDEKEKEAGA